MVAAAMSVAASAGIESAATESCSSSSEAHESNAAEEFHTALMQSVVRMRRGGLAASSSPPVGAGGAPGAPKVCNLCAEKWTIVLATGRSGSTSLIQMLDALPGFLIAGEHDGVLVDLMQFYKTLFDNGSDYLKNAMGAGQEAHLNHTNTSKIYPFFHQHRSEDRVLCELQELVKVALLGDMDRSQFKVFGFKEIRYSSPEMLELLSKLFPCARFVVNVRGDLSMQANSAFWSVWPEWIKNDMLKQVTAGFWPGFNADASVMKILQGETDSLLAWQAKQPSQRFLLRMEDFTLQGFNELLQWLGVKNCAYTQVAYSNSVGQAVEAKVSGECTLPGTF